jgi:cell division protein FtsB
MKVSIPAVILILVLIAAITVLVVFQMKIGQLNNEISDLKKVVAAEAQTNDDAQTEDETAQAENEALRTENKSLKSETASLKADNDALSAENKALNTDIETLKQYQLTLYVPLEYQIAIDQRLETSLIDLIKKHIKAIETGNIDDYRSTLINKDNAYLLGIYTEQKKSDLAVTSISAPDIMGVGPITNGPFFLAVTYKKDGELTIDYIGVTKINKKWVVYDYD